MIVAKKIDSVINDGDDSPTVQLGLKSANNDLPFVKDRKVLLVKNKYKENKYLNIPIFL